MLYALLKTAHLLSIVVWIGGMFFANFCLRPSLAALDGPVRLRLVHAVFSRFFRIVLIASIVTLVSGLWMIALASAQANFHMPIGWTVMATGGLAMVAIFGHIRFALFKRLDRAVTLQDWPAGAAALGLIRKAVLMNLALGLAIIVVLRLSSAPI